MLRRFDKNLRRTALILLAMTGVAGTLVAHNILANFYCDLNSLQLGIAAEMAVTAGSEFLPDDPRAAIQAADTYALHHGIAAEEIAFTGTDSDNLTLTIRLCRKMPWYVTLFTVGLPHRSIRVTGTARRRSGQPEAALRRTSW